MYERITGDNPYEVPMRIFPAVHYTMGGLWVDYELQSTVPGLFVLGEANFSDHGANRLGASALMQGLADGYFVIPYTLGNYIAGFEADEVTTDHDAFAASEQASLERVRRLLDIQGNKTVSEFHRELGQIMWDHVGMARNHDGLQQAITQIAALRDEFWQNVRVPGVNETFNKNLEFAGRVADFLELGELMARDALHREESSGGHFREEYQTAEGEALRDDENFAYVAAWAHSGNTSQPELHKEDLDFEYVRPSTRSYK
jgi:succinate dehydrogenase / fumarate reductase flavoprotein subunit